MLLPLIVLLVGGGATVWIHQLLVRDAEQLGNAYFAERVGEAQAAIRVRVTHYTDALHGGASHLAAAPETDRESWKVYTESLDLRRRYPGINGLGFIFAVPPEGVAHWKSRMMAKGAPQPEIRPFPGTTAGPPDAVKYLITAVESGPGETPPIGRDIATEPSRRKAAELARDSGNPCIHQRIPGSRDTVRRAGLLLYVPVYRRGMPLGSVTDRRAAHLGWVYAQIFPDIFLEGVLAPLSEKLNLHFFEAGELSRETLLYASRPTGDGPLPQFEKVNEMTLAGQQFHLGWSRGNTFPHVDRSSPRLVAASMGLATLFLMGLVLSLQSTGRRANAMVTVRTSDLATSEERFRQAFDFAGIGMALVGMDGQLLRVNQGFCDIIGYSKSRLLQKKFQDFTHPDDLAADLALLDQLIAGGRRSYQLEKRYIHRDGHNVWVRLTVSLVRDADGKPLNAIAQVEDIAERRRLEASLANARDQALEGSRETMALLAALIHEIRAPANELMGTVARLRNRLAPEQAEFVNALETSGETFLKVLSNILDYWNLQFNPVEFEHQLFHLPECINQSVANYESRAQEKGLTLECAIASSVPTRVAGDAKRLSQIISSLLAVAIKFTDTGEVRLNLTAEPLDAGTGRQRLKFAVRDTSSGIAANPMFRSGGTIELAISKRLTELMGGTFWTECGLGRGTTFHFTISVEPREESSGNPSMRSHRLHA